MKYIFPRSYILLDTVVKKVNSYNTLSMGTMEQYVTLDILYEYSFGSDTHMHLL